MRRGACVLGFVAFHITSRPRRPQKIKEKWQDAQSFPRGTLAIPTSREGGCGWELRGRSTAEDPTQAARPPVGRREASERDGLYASDCQTPIPPSASTEHRPLPPRFIWLSRTVAPRSSANWAIGASLVHYTISRAPAYCAISQSLLIMDMGSPGGAI